MAAVGEGEIAGERGRIVEEGARRRRRGRETSALGLPSSSARGEGGREEHRGARLLQRDVGAEDRRVGRADDAEHRAVGVDHRDRDLGAAVERAADLGARGAHDLERFLEDRAHFGGGERGAAIGAGDGSDSGWRPSRW